MRVWIDGLDTVHQRREAEAFTRADTVQDLLSVAAMAAGEIAVSRDQLVDHAGLQAFVIQAAADRSFMDALQEHRFLRFCGDSDSLEDSIVRALDEGMEFSSLTVDDNQRIRTLRSSRERYDTFRRLHADRHGEGALDAYERALTSIGGIEQFPRRDETPISAYLRALGLQSASLKCLPGISTQEQEAFLGRLLACTSRSQAYEVLRESPILSSEGRRDLRAVVDVANAYRRMEQIEAEAYHQPACFPSWFESPDEIVPDDRRRLLTREAHAQLVARVENLKQEPISDLVSWPAVIALRQSAKWSAFAARIEEDMDAGRPLGETRIAEFDDIVLAVLGETFGEEYRRKRTKLMDQWIVRLTPLWLAVAVGSRFGVAQAELAESIPFFVATVRALPEFRRVPVFDLRRTLGKVLGRKVK